MQLKYHIAETIGMMVSELEERMPVEEFFGWGSWFKYKADEERKAVKKAKQGSKGRRGRR
jgi:hypothetical protein